MTDIPASPTRPHRTSADRRSHRRSDLYDDASEVLVAQDAAVERLHDEADMLNRIDGIVDAPAQPAAAEVEPGTSQLARLFTSQPDELHTSDSLAARRELRRALRDRYEVGLASLEDPDLDDQ
jgi:hypothetical protein